MSDEEIIQQPIRALLEIYLKELAEVRFGEVDGKALQLAAEHVERRVQLVRTAEQSLATARADLDSAEKALLSTAQQAMGYARIFAQDRPDLLANLEAISLPGRQRELVMTPSGSPTRPRGRQSRLRSDAQSGQLQVESALVTMDTPLAPMTADQPGGLSDATTS